MIKTEMDNRLRQLRRGFDIAIEKTLREKAAKGQPVVVAAEDGTPSLRDARHALADFLRERHTADAPACRESTASAV